MPSNRSKQFKQPWRAVGSRIASVVRKGKARTANFLQDGKTRYIEGPRAASYMRRIKPAFPPPPPAFSPRNTERILPYTEDSQEG